MPLFNNGETILTDSIEESSGSPVYLVQDSDRGGIGFFYQFAGAAQQYHVFFVDQNGEVSGQDGIGEDQSFYVATYDQDAVVVYPTSEDAYDLFPPTVYRRNGDPVQIDPDKLADYPPLYRLDGSGLTTAQTDELAGRATETMLKDGGRAELYQADDGDGTGIFIRVYDADGHLRGGITRVNDNVAGDQKEATIIPLDDGKFTVAWTQSDLGEDSSLELRSKTFDVLASNIGAGVTGGISGPGNDTLSGDIGDHVTDIFFFDTARSDGLGRDRIEQFGANDILVTTTKIFDSNGDGIITFGRDKLLNINNLDGDRVADVSVAGLRSLEYDGTVKGDGVTYYVYSKVGSVADEHYLIV